MSDTGVQGVPRYLRRYDLHLHLGRSLATSSHDDVWCAMLLHGMMLPYLPLKNGRTEVTEATTSAARSRATT